MGRSGARWWFGAPAVFVACFAFLLPWIFQGLDLVDSGWHLTNQQQLYAHASPSGMPTLHSLWLLTDLVGGAWLSLGPRPSLLWARLGGVLLLSGSAAAAHGTLTTFFDRRRAFLAVLVGAAVVTMRSPRFLIEYYTLPAFLLTVALLLLARTVTCREPARLRLRALLLGSVVAASILARFVLVGIVVVPVAIALYLWRARQGEPLRSVVAWIVAGAVASAGVLLALFGALGHLGSYTASVASQLSGGLGSGGGVEDYHRMGVVLSRQFSEYGHVVKLTALAVAGLVGTGLIARVVGRRIALAGLALLVVGASWRQATTAGVEYFALSLIHLAIGFVLVVSITFLLLDRGRHAPLDVVVIASTLIMVISPLGSADGIYKSIHGMWVALPLAILLTYEIVPLMGRRGAELLRFPLFLRPAILITAGSVCAAMQYGNHFRDEARSKLVAPFTSPGLELIRSTPERVKTVDAAVRAIVTRSDPTDPILIAGEAAMFYYVTARTPLLAEPWIELEPLESIQRMVDSEDRSSRLPALILIDTTTLDEDTFNDVGPKATWLTEHYTASHGYRLTWEEGPFRLYEPPRPDV